MSNRKWSRSEVENFLAEEDLQYQRIDLPFGLSTQGDPRIQTRDIVLAEVESYSVLDVGSYLGLFCIESLRQGAASATGFELDRKKLGQAKVLAEICNLEPNYLCKDIERDAIEEQFDIVLLLNVLHHTANPIAVLRKFANATKRKMFIEIAALHGTDLRKIEDNPIKRRFVFSWRPTFRWLSRRPLMFAIPAYRGQQNQTFLMTESLVRSVLSQHMTLFHSIKVHQIERKKRVLLECERLNLGELVVVAGTTSAGKSTLCDKIIDGDEPCFRSAKGAPLLSPNSIQNVGLESLVPDPRYPVAVLHYDMMSAINNRKRYSFQRDPILDVLKCAEKVSIVLAAPNLDVLRCSLVRSEAGKTGNLSDWHQFCLHKYDDADYVRDLYASFVDFVQASRPDATFRIYTWDFPSGDLVDSPFFLSSELAGDETISLLGVIYT